MTGSVFGPHLKGPTTGGSFSMHGIAAGGSDVNPEAASAGMLALGGLAVLR